MLLNNIQLIFLFVQNSFFLLTFIGEQLIYNVVLVSGVQQSKSLIRSDQPLSRVRLFATP